MERKINADNREVNERGTELIYANEVVKYTDVGWAVMAQGVNKPCEVFDSKQAAVTAAKEIAKNKKSSVREYLKDGSLID